MYRQLRTNEVLLRQWRDPDQLVDSLDHDEYDEAEAATTSVVMVRGQRTLLGGLRLTPVESIESSLSFRMWESSPPSLANDEGVADTSIELLGASICVHRDFDGALFTIDTEFLHRLTAAGLGIRTVHLERLGPSQAAFAYITIADCATGAHPRVRRLMSTGAAAFDLAAARTMPFWEPPEGSIG